MTELKVSLFLFISVFLCSKHSALWCHPFITDHYPKPRSLRTSYSRLGGLVETDRVPNCNLCLRLKCFVWDAGGGALGWGGGQLGHKYSYRGGLRAACYVWVVESSKRHPPLKHFPPIMNLGFYTGYVLPPLIFTEGHGIFLP